MAAPVVTWVQVISNNAYTSIQSLNFGTVTAGSWSTAKVIRPSVATNSIQSCKWWLYDALGARSGSADTVGTGQSWAHGITITGTYVTVSTTLPKASAGYTEMPESTGSAVSYAAVSYGAYGNYVYLGVKVATAAGDGAWTAWGYQLKYSYT
jgi:hypothetical protein